MMREDPKYKDKDVWDIEYKSTSNQEDMETESSEESSSDYDDEDDEEEKKKAEDEDDGEEGKKEKKVNMLKGGDKVPELAKRLKRDKVMRGKKTDRKVRYEYASIDDGVDENGKPVKKVIKRLLTNSRKPQNLIDILLLNKHSLYKKE